MIDEKKCIGCGACAQACPYGAPVLDETAHKMHKCDVCADRLVQGLRPICVEACPQRAIEFGEISELHKKYGDNADIAPLPSSSLTKPSLVIRPLLQIGKQGKGQSWRLINLVDFEVLFDSGFHMNGILSF